MSPRIEIDESQIESSRRKYAPPNAFQHYYGDTVRRLFVAAGIVILVALPFFNDVLPVPTFISLLALLVVNIVAGLTNPMQRWIMFFDVIVSILALLSFEYHAISRYNDIPLALFATDQLLTIIFFFALYYSVKSLRGLMVSDLMIKQRKREAQERQDKYPLKH
ncbi:MAG: hypothetical protein HYR90_01855 [Candidatus Andersenbacteria bacterium]|nr:hypothetical protein [Candidatus Andersenbacteria bacterium]MBI3250905.1 hypothetical protein [Candidatus Andersenbacteria bacterium]